MVNQTDHARLAILEANVALLQGAPSPPGGGGGGSGTTTLPAGVYDTYLSMPDKSISIRTRPEYAIQCANTTAAGFAWNTGLGGYNALGHQITVGSGAQANTTKTYTRSTAVILNPERGFFQQEVGPDSGYDFLSQAQIALDKTNLNATLRRRIFNLAAFLGTDTISGTYLANMVTDFATARAAGIKLVVRFAYNYDNDNTNIDVSLARMLTHIDQLAATVNANLDVIAAIDMGFIGKWGEQHYAGSAGDDGDNGFGNGWWGGDWSLRDDLLQKILDSFQDRQILIRYPRHSAWYSTRVTPTSRLGFKNDSFLADADSEGGTYDESGHPSAPDGGKATFQIPWLQGAPRAVGGEHESGSYTDAERRTNFGDFLTQRWSFLNYYYNTVVTDMWRANNHPDATKYGTVTYHGRLDRDLGYRLVLKGAVLPNVVPVGGTLTALLTMENEGYAAPFNHRDMYLVLRNVASPFTEYKFSLNSFNIQTLTPTAGVRTISQSFPTAA